MTPNRTRIKFCGITRPRDVEAAIAAGADALGFNAYPRSSRFVPLEDLAELARCVGPFVTPVLLFVNADSTEIRRRIDFVPDALLQFHGDESPELCASFGRPYLRAARIADAIDWQRTEAAFADATAVLADTPSAAFGGMGRTFDWTLLPALAQRRKRLVLAGGLDATNVAEAIRATRPYAVDVSSGIEDVPGEKSATKMREFAAAVRAIDCNP